MKVRIPNPYFCNSGYISRLKMDFSFRNELPSMFEQDIEMLEQQANLAHGLRNY